MDLKPLKVREVNHYISKLISNDVLLYNINVEGEVSNSKYHTNGHIYFSLKDDRSKVRCIMFVNNAERLDFKIEDGAKIVVSGSISVYEKDGSYQVNVRKAKLSGRGELYNKFERLKEKLFLEGLFDESKKKEIPRYPQKIGIVTSVTGATVRDMIVNIRRRNSGVNILIMPTLVQGSASKDEIVRSIEKLNKRNDIDTIIVGRGGGSIEELWSFNEERVARAIYKSDIPVISAVGHETDFTIADFVADKRASTPSVAAEIAVIPSVEIENKLESIYNNMLRAKLNRIRDERDRLDRMGDRLSLQSPKNQIESHRERLERKLGDLNALVDKGIEKNQQSLSKLLARLEDLSPLATLNRGYALVRDKSTRIITLSEQVEVEDPIRIQLKDGEIMARVESISIKEK